MLLKIANKKKEMLRRKKKHESKLKREMKEEGKFEQKEAPLRLPDDVYYSTYTHIRMLH